MQRVAWRRPPQHCSRSAGTITTVALAGFRLPRLSSSAGDVQHARCATPLKMLQKSGQRQCDVTRFIVSTYGNDGVSQGHTAFEDGVAQVLDRLAHMGYTHVAGWHPRSICANLWLSCSCLPSACWRQQPATVGTGNRTAAFCGRAKGGEPRWKTTSVNRATLRCARTALRLFEVTSTSASDAGARRRFRRCRCRTSRSSQRDSHIEQDPPVPGRLPS